MEIETDKPTLVEDFRVFLENIQDSFLGVVWLSSLCYDDERVVLFFKVSVLHWP